MHLELLGLYLLHQMCPVCLLLDSAHTAVCVDLASCKAAVRSRFEVLVCIHAVQLGLQETYCSAHSWYVPTAFMQRGVWLEKG